MSNTRSDNVQSGTLDNNKKPHIFTDKDGNIVEVRLRKSEVWIFYSEVDEPEKINKKDLTKEKKEEIIKFITYNE